jgi:hypothetical protein
VWNLFLLMRAKIVIPILGLSVLLFALVMWLKPSASTPQVAAAPAPTTSLTSPSASAAPRETFQPKIDPVALVEERKDFSRQRVSELMQMGATKDAQFFHSVLADLTSDDPAIRRAALTATVDYADRSAIPALQQAADALADPQEKVNLLHAIDFLKLPTFTEANAGAASGTAPVSRTFGN